MIDTKREIHSQLMKDKIMYPVTSSLVITAERVEAARKLVCDELENLRQDYYPELSDEDFIRQHIYPNSLHLFRLQARCFYLGLAEIITTNELLNFVSQHISSFDLYYSCFLRFHHPAMTSNGKRRLDNVVSSPLHYDNYGADTRTTWIPLQDIDESTGTLCYTDAADLVKMTGDGIAPNQMHGEELLQDTHDAYIASLRKNLKLIKCKAGQVVMFDKSLLHGSTYPESALRVSVDVRWIATEPSNLTNRDRVQKQFRIFRKNALIGVYRNEDAKFWRRVRKWEFPFVHLKMGMREIQFLRSAVRALRNLVK